MQFPTAAAVKDWADKNGGEAAVWRGIFEGKFLGDLDTKNALDNYFKSCDAMRDALRDENETKWRERQVVANETSASASRVSSRAAFASAVSAGCSAIIALVSLYFSMRK